MDVLGDLQHSAGQVEVSVLIFGIAVLVMRVEDDHRLFAGELCHALVAGVVMMVRALALGLAAGQFLAPGIACVRVDVSLRDEVSILVIDGLGGALTGQVSPHAGIAFRGMVVSFGLRRGADELQRGGVAARVVLMRLDLRKRAPQVAVFVVAVLVVRMHEEVGIARPVLRLRRAGQNRMIGLGNACQVEGTRNPGGHQDREADHQRQIRRASPVPAYEWIVIGFLFHCIFSCSDRRDREARSSPVLRIFCSHDNRSQSIKASMMKANLRHVPFSYISESFWLQKHFNFLKYN